MDVEMQDAFSILVDDYDDEIVDYEDDDEVMIEDNLEKFEKVSDACFIKETDTVKCFNNESKSTIREYTLSFRDKQLDDAETKRLMDNFQKRNWVNQQNIGDLNHFNKNFGTKVQNSLKETGKLMFYFEANKTESLNGTAKLPIIEAEKPQVWERL
ncbi:hypothetical protein G9A89_016454 [Geosiphon pyriformis]|nr:hypothetical protein G9A89_016454 [Geosiphon pyriformis]